MPPKRKIETKVKNNDEQDGNDRKPKKNDKTNKKKQGRRGKDKAGGKGVEEKGKKVADEGTDVGDEPAAKTEKEHTELGDEEPQIGVVEEILEVTAEEVQEILHAKPLSESPVDLSLIYEHLAQVSLPSLEWQNFGTVPKALKLTNTSYSVVLTGAWLKEQMPFVAGGPLMDDYVFSQIHFHWGGLIMDFDARGKNDKVWIMSGSEHTVDNEQLPFEMHVVFHKRSCGSHEQAKREPNGIMIMAYLCADITEEDNPYLTPITKKLFRIFHPNTSKSISIMPLANIVPQFNNDYVAYMGYMKFKCNHGILWLISRKSFFMSLYQFAKFQGVMNKTNRPITNPFREVQALDHRPIFLINPSGDYKTFIHYRDEDIGAVIEERDSVAQGEAELRGTEDRKRYAKEKYFSEKLLEEYAEEGEHEIGQELLEEQEAEVELNDNLQNSSEASQKS